MLYCRENLILRNPKHAKLAQMGKWGHNEPLDIWLYEIADARTYILPFGCLAALWKLNPHAEDYSLDLAMPAPVTYHSRISLRDYQETAQRAAVAGKNGIVVMPCGSGKTETALSTIAELGQRTLWITHTIDLLHQSEQRARDRLGLMGAEIGEITDGRATIGSHITFATVQTLAKWKDIEKHKYTWPVIIVDEAHRAFVSAKGMGMFERCLGSLAARHKIGLTATAHRSDGLIGGMFALIGDTLCEVSRDAVSDKTVPVQIAFRSTNYDYSDDVLDADGTIIFSKLVEDIALDAERNEQIAADMRQNTDHKNLVLSDRIFHLNMLRDLLPPEARAAIVDGKTPAKKREAAMTAMRNGELDYLFATYQLAREGLDLPRLDRLYMALPKKDYAVVVQSVGRIARQFDGKSDAIVYDYVDPVGMCKKMYRERQKHYRACGYQTNLITT